MDTTQAQNALTNNTPNNQNLNAMFSAGFPMGFMMQGGDPRMAATATGGPTTDQLQANDLASQSAAAPPQGQDFNNLMNALNKLQHLAATTPAAPAGGAQNTNTQAQQQIPQPQDPIYQGQPGQPGQNPANDQVSDFSLSMNQLQNANAAGLQGMLGGAAAGGFMIPQGGAGGFAGAPGFLGFDMTNPMAAAGFNPFMFGFPPGGAAMMPQAWFPGGNANAFHAPGQKNEIKLFVGGLQFQTSETDLYQYFNQFGQVLDQIVMRDKQTNRGRGFGFVKMSFKDEEEAQKGKEQIINQNQYPGHYILDKKVDVKSADDYHEKKTIGGMGGMGQSPAGAMLPGYGAPFIPGAGVPGGFGVPGVQKPNPYAIAETKTKGESGVEVSFKYPRSKIFVGGLDFKLSQEELKHHFMQYGEVLDACILKDIYTGQSRGFGFVTFKDEDVAQHLINGIQVTTIGGRKADIKKAEVKAGQQGGGGMGGSGFGSGGQGGYGQKGGFRDQAGPATIPPYGSGGGGKDDSFRDNERHGGGGHHSVGNHRGNHRDNFGGGDRRGYRQDKSRSGSPQRRGRSDSNERGDRRRQGGGGFRGQGGFGGGQQSMNRGGGGGYNRMGGPGGSGGHNMGGGYQQNSNAGKRREDSRERKRRSRSR